MSWTEWKIQQYNQGATANWLEKKYLVHANPVNFIFHVLGAIPFIYGLWNHIGLFILVGMGICGIGHLYCSIIKDEYGHER